MSGGDLDFEPVRGLPANLPAGEALLWQGAPDLKATALRVFHIRKVAIYFVVLAAWRFGTGIDGGASLASAAYGSLPLVGLGLAAVAILTGLSWLVCKTTVYSITSRRVVMRIGVALPIHFNLPFKVIESASLKLNGDGTGTVPLLLTDDNRLSYLVLWPHARPWHFSRAEPSLRLVPEAARVAQILAQAAAGALPASVQTSVPASQKASAGDPSPWPLAPAAV